MSIYRSPIHLLGKTIPNDITKNFVKKRKKELLLQFQLSSSGTIEIGNHTYDKNGLIQAFDDLVDNFYFHEAIYKNKALLDYLETGNVAFFEIPEAWKDFKDTDFATQLLPVFSQRYAQELYNYLSKKSFQNQHLLKAVFESGFSLPSNYEDLCFAKGFEWLEDHIKRIGVLVNEPELFVRKQKTLYLQGDFYKIFHFGFFNKMKALPPAFDGLKSKLVDVSSDLLNRIIDEENRFEYMDRDTIHQMRRICVYIYDTTEAGEMYKNIRVICCI